MMGEAVVKPANLASYNLYGKKYDNQISCLTVVLSSTSNFVVIRLLTTFTLKSCDIHALCLGEVSNSRFITPRQFHRAFGVFCLVDNQM